MKRNRLRRFLSLFAAAVMARADAPSAPQPKVKDFFYVYADKSHHEIQSLRALRLDGRCRRSAIYGSP